MRSCSWRESEARKEGCGEMLRERLVRDAVAFERICCLRVRLVLETQLRVAGRMKVCAAASIVRFGGQVEASTGRARRDIEIWESRRLGSINYQSGLYVAVVHQLLSAQSRWLPIREAQPELFAIEEKSSLAAQDRSGLPQQVGWSPSWSSGQWYMSRHTTQQLHHRLEARRGQRRRQLLFLHVFVDLPM